MAPKLKQQLEARLKEIDTRRAAIEAEQQRLDAKSYRFQELAHEYRALLSLRFATERELNPPDPATNEAHRLGLKAQAERMRERHQSTNTRPEVIAERQVKRRKIIDALEAEERSAIEVTAQKFERQGDYRQARIWRESAWQVRHRLERQIP
jgi:hypothetical protein